MQDTYTDGFLDGMRYSGHLLADVEDVHLNLTDECKHAIQDAYVKRNYLLSGRGAKMHSFITRLITDTRQLEEENARLRSLLTGKATVDKKEMNYLELI